VTTWEAQGRHTSVVIGVLKKVYKQYGDLYVSLIFDDLDADVGDESIIWHDALIKGKGSVVLVGYVFNIEKYG